LNNWGWLVKLPEFIRTNARLTDIEFHQQNAPAFLLLNQTQADDGEYEDRFETIRADGGENPVTQELTETVVIPLVKRDPDAPGFMITVGRTTRCDVLFHSPAISKFHAYFRCSPGTDEWSLTDAGSVNGTTVNGDSLETSVPRMLSGGDSIVFGQAFGGTFHTAASLKRHITFYQRLM
jgi:hypothetical protein